MPEHTSAHLLGSAKFGLRILTLTNANIIEYESKRDGIIRASFLEYRRNPLGPCWGLPDLPHLRQQYFRNNHKTFLRGTGGTEITNIRLIKPHLIRSSNRFLFTITYRPLTHNMVYCVLI